MHRAEQLDIARAEAPARLRASSGTSLMGRSWIASRRAASAASRDRRRGSIPACRRRNRGGRVARRRIEIEDAAAHGILPRIGHGAGADIADMPQAARSARHVHRVAGREASCMAPAKNSRGGTRCSTALTVVSTISGVSSLPPRCWQARRAWRRGGRRSRRLAPPGRKARRPRRESSGASRQARRNASASSSVASALAVAGDMQDRLAGLAARDAPCERAEHRGVEALRHAAGDRALRPSSRATGRLRDVDVSAIQQSLAAFMRPGTTRGSSAGAPSACRGRHRQANSVEQACGNFRVGNLDQALDRQISVTDMVSTVCSAKRPSRKSNSLLPRWVAR